MEVKFCERNFVSSSTMRVIFDIRTKLLQELRALKFIQSRGGGGDMRDLNTNSERWPMVKGALCAGLYPNLMRVDRVMGEAIQPKGGKIRFHSSSILYHPPAAPEGNNAAGCTIDNAHQRTIAALPTDWLLFERVGKSSRRHSTIKCCTAVSAITVGLFAGKTRQLSLEVSERAFRTPTAAAFGSGPVAASSMMMPFGQMKVEIVNDADMGPFNHGFKLKIDESISFSMDYNDLCLIHCLRIKFHALVMRRMRQPGKGWTTLDQNVLTSVERVLCNEEDFTGLQQPSGIGQRPRQMQMDFISPRSQQKLFPAVASSPVPPSFMANPLLQQQQHPQSFPTMPIFNGHALAPPNFTVGPPVDRKIAMSGGSFDLGGGGDSRPPFPPSGMNSRQNGVQDPSLRLNVFNPPSMSSRPTSLPSQSTSSKYAVVSQSSAKEHLKFHNHSKSFGGHHGGNGPHSGHGLPGSHGGGHSGSGGHSIGRSSSEGAFGQKESNVAFFVVKPRSSEVFDYAVAKGEYLVCFLCSV